MLTAFRSFGLVLLFTEKICTPVRYKAYFTRRHSAGLCVSLRIYRFLFDMVRPDCEHENIIAERRRELVLKCLCMH